MSALSQQWTEKLSDWRRSGLSMAAWCRQNDEGYYRFLYWRKRLQPKQSEGPGRFVELPVGRNRSPLCLECNGIYLHLDQGFDPGLLREVLAVLKKA
jgi:hypothetical protein